MSEQMGAGGARRQPSEQMRRLGRLVGDWQVSGGASGTVTFDWLDGGHFLLQRVNLDHGGRRVAGIEVIGHERPFGAEPGTDVRSRFYGDEGDTLDYVYDLDGDTLTIWGGERGSPAYYRGVISADGAGVTGSWVYPGGGYESVMRRTGS